MTSVMNELTAVRRNALFSRLRKAIAGEVRGDQPTRLLYATDAGIHRVEPLGVVLPKTRDDLTTTVQFAAELGMPITMRGGGTSLSGQAIGPGIVIDCSKYLHQVTAFDPTSQRVRVQPGIVLANLNRFLEPHGLLFGPDVSTAKQATIGGMIGNNSAGSHSILYGMTGDHVTALDCIFSDGSTAAVRRVSAVEWEQAAETETLLGRAVRLLRHLASRHRDEITARFPKIPRRVSGYNLAAYVEAEPRSLLPILVGSEGTLATIAEAELSLVPRPKVRGLLVPHFDSLRSALDALAVCLSESPSAVELMDTLLIELARTQRSLKEAIAAIQGNPAALLLVEFRGDSPIEVRDRIERLKTKLRGARGLSAVVIATEARLRDPLWNLRSGAVPLLYGIPGERKPVAFCEDTAVAPAQLPEFATRFREVLRKHGTDGAFYGHASVGCMHIRPLLNLKEPTEQVRMRAIMEDITDLVLEFGGSLSGEHGDGFVRSEWHRKMFGPIISEAFRRIKHAFDPFNVFNPGRIVDAPAMTENLRFASERVSLPTVFDYSKQGGFFRSIELCNGSGVCRKTQTGTMCPSYRATLDEQDSTRGRANALREVLTTSARENPLAERWLGEVMNLCLGCKACKSECPSNVDMAKLKGEWQHAFYRKRPRPLGHFLAANIHWLNRWGAAFAPLTNRLQSRPWVRALLHHLAGIDRRRSLPTLHWHHFRRWFDRRPKRGQGRRVILLDDCFTTYNEPRIGRATVRVLEAAGCRVERLGLRCCGRALLSKGFLPQAQALARDQLPLLAELVADGTPILGLEPSCLLTLVDEWPELVPGADAEQVAASAHLAEAWLGAEIAAGRLSLSLMQQNQKCLFHGHCHQRALIGVSGTADALRLIPGLQVETLDVGCCGMAGSFGYEREHYDISVRIAELGLLPALRAEEEALVAATGTSCRHQVHDLLGRRVRHPMEILATALTDPGSQVLETRRRRRSD